MEAKNELKVTSNIVKIKYAEFWSYSCLFQLKPTVLGGITLVKAASGNRCAARTALINSASVDMLNHDRMSPWWPWNTETICRWLHRGEIHHSPSASRTGKKLQIVAGLCRVVIQPSAAAPPTLCKANLAYLALCVLCWFLIAQFTISA